MFDSVAGLFSQPVFALLLGIACGAGLLFASYASFKRMTPENPERGLLVVALTMIARLAVATLVLWAYKRYFPATVKPFGLALATTFLVLYTAEAVRYSGLLRERRPASVGR